MKTFIFSTIVGLSLIACSHDLNMQTTPVPESEKAKTTLGLYVTAKEAGKYLAQDKSAIFIDVRSSAELKFTGAATRMDFHVPYKILDRTSYMDKVGSYGMATNKYFMEEIIFELDKRGAKKNHPIFITCRSGSSRSAPVVNALALQGYTDVWTLTDGFQGGKVKEGKYKGERVKDGWLHSELEWGWKVPKEKLWFPCKYKMLFDPVDAQKCE